MTMPGERRVISVKSLGNRAFLERYARPGRIGLAGGGRLLERMIRKAQRGLHPEGLWSDWSHAFLFVGKRADGRHWVLESDLDVLRKQIRFGVQENRADKFFNASAYPFLGVMDLDLKEDQVRGVLTGALDLLAQRTAYSLRELAGTLLALKRPRLRTRENLLAREGSLYCSAFVQHCFRGIGIDLAPGLSEKNTTPLDIAQTPHPHTLYLLSSQATRPGRKGVR
jgi:hypothetical protein